MKATRIQFRTRILPDGTARGYQADVAKGYWGLLLEEGSPNRLIIKRPAPEAVKKVKPDAWNDYRDHRQRPPDHAGIERYQVRRSGRPDGRPQRCHCAADPRRAGDGSAFQGHQDQGIGITRALTEDSGRPVAGRRPRRARAECGRGPEPSARRAGRDRTSEPTGWLTTAADPAIPEHRRHRRDQGGAPWPGSATPPRNRHAPRRPRPCSPRAMRSSWASSRNASARPSSAPAWPSTARWSSSTGRSAATSSSGRPSKDGGPR